MKNSEIRSPMDGLLTGIKAIDGELVAEGNELFTVSSRRNYVRGEVNEEDVGEVKIGMKAHPAGLRLSHPAIRRQSHGDSCRRPIRKRSATPIVLDLENPPENLLAGMTGEMNIITGQHENALLVPTRALLVDQALIGEKRHRSGAHGQGRLSHPRFCRSPRRACRKAIA